MRALSEIATSIPVTGQTPAQNMPFPSLSYCKFRHYINIELESDLPIFGRQLTRELSATSSAGLE
jgi:hypothetical protein